MPAVVSVRGGVGGVEAEYAAMSALADRFDAAGDRARDWAVAVARVGTDEALLASAPWSPATFAAAGSALVAAGAGPSGALGCAVEWELEAVAVRGVVVELRRADAAARRAVEVRDQALGQVVGGGLRLGVLAAAPAVVALAATRPDLVRRLQGVAAERLPAVGRVVVEHPRLVEALADGGGGVVDGFLGLPPTHDHRGGAALLAGRYDDGRPAVRELEPADLARLARAEGVPLPAAAARPPAGVADLLGGLAAVAALSRGASSPLNGTIAVTTLRGPDGPRHVVYLPGTDDLATLPPTQDADVRDLGTDLALMAGEPTAYGAGVLEAMARAGVRPDEPVLLVGHSLGGMQAAALAASGAPYDLGWVVTAGSPLAQVDLPPGVHALSIENEGDVVPLLDGRPNAPGLDQVTVTVAAGGDGVAGHHDHEAYLRAATAVDASGDPSVRAEVAALREAGFLRPDRVTDARTRVFQVTRR